MLCGRKGEAVTSLSASFLISLPVDTEPTSFCPPAETQPPLLRLTVSPYDIPDDLGQEVIKSLFPVIHSAGRVSDLLKEVYQATKQKNMKTFYKAPISHPKKVWPYSGLGHVPCYA